MPLQPVGLQHDGGRGGTENSLAVDRDRILPAGQLLAMIALELLRLLSRAAGRTTPTGRLGLPPRRAAERFVAAALETTWRGSPIGGGHCGTTTSPRSIA
jgi:hypothetical protein